jgi:hypothetical protein
MGVMTGRRTVGITGTVVGAGNARDEDKSPARSGSAGSIDHARPDGRVAAGAVLGSITGAGTFIQVT